MPADERPRDSSNPPADGTSPADAPAADEKKERSGLTIAAAGVAGAAVVGTAAGAAVGGASHLLDSQSGDEDGESASDDGAAEALSIDVFEDIEPDTEQTTSGDGATGTIDASALASQQAAQRAPADPDSHGTTYDGLGDDPRRVGPRGDSSTPTASSVSADATLIAATETGATGVAGAPSAVPTAPLINRPAQPADPPPPPAPPQSSSQASFHQEPPPPPPAPPAPVNPVAATPGESFQPAPAGSTSSNSGGIDVIDDIGTTPDESSSPPQPSASVADAPAEDVTPAGPATVPDGEGVASSQDASSDSGSDSSQSPGMDYGHPPAQQTDPDYGAQPPAYKGYPPDQQADPDYGMKPPPYQVKPPVKVNDDDYVKDDDYQDAAPPPYFHDDDNDEYPVVDDYVDDVVEDPVYAPYYDPFPGDKGYGHPQDLYGDPQPPGPNQATNVYVFRGEHGQDYATIIRDDNGNETITWWYGDPPDGHVVYEVYVTHDGYGNYNEQITSYPVHEVDLVLSGIEVDSESLLDPDIQYGKNNAEEVIDHQLVTRTWTDDDGNLVIKKMYRDGSGKIEITFGSHNGLQVVYQQGQYAYYENGQLIDGQEYVPDPQVEEPAIDGANPLAAGPGYFIEEQYVNPLTAGFEPLAVGNNVNYIDPQTGASVSVTDLGGGVYQVSWRLDPNMPPGTFDMVAKVQVDANGNYLSYNPTYYTGNVEIEAIGPLGYVPVNGDPYQDPWNAYGFPAGNASQIVSEDTVVQTWETADGPITKTFYRDGSFKTVIEYPDGVVITYDPNVNPYPTYETPDGFGDTNEPYEGVEGAYLPPTAPETFEYNGETYPNPEADDSYTYQKTEGPFGTPGGTVVQHHYVGEDGYLIIVSVHSDGQYEIMYGDPNTPMAGWDMRIVMQADGSYAPLPEFTINDPSTDGEDSPAMAGEPRTYYSNDYVHPEDQYPEGPLSTQWSGDNRVDNYLDAQVWTRMDGSQEIIWLAVGDDGSILTTQPPLATPGSPTLVGGSEPTAVPVHAMHVSVLVDGSHIIKTLPPEAWRVVPHWMGNDGEYRDPDLDDMSYTETFRGIDGGARLYREYEDGTIKEMERSDGTLYIWYPDGAVIQIAPDGMDTLLRTAEGDLSDEDAPSEVDSSLDADPVMDPTGDEDPDADIFEPWTAHLPPYFPIDGSTYVNPEAYLGGNNTFSLISESETQRVYESNGYLVRITEQPGGVFSFEWGSDLSNPDIALDVSPDGSYEVLYSAAENAVSDADAGDEPWQMGGPEVFTVADGVSFANPEYDNEYEYSHSSDDGKTHFYQTSDGYQAVIQEMGTHHTVFYGPNPPVAIDLVVNVQPDGSYTVPFYPGGEGEDGETADIAIPDFAPIIPDLPFDLSDVLPDQPTGPIGPLSVEPEPSYDWWTSHLPASWEIDGQTYINPESAQGIESGYALYREGEDYRTYATDDGYAVRITQLPGGAFSMAWGENTANPDIAIQVNADGTYHVTHVGENAPEPSFTDKLAAPEETEPAASGEETTIIDKSDAAAPQEEEPLDFGKADTPEEARSGPGAIPSPEIQFNVPVDRSEAVVPLVEPDPTDADPIEPLTQPQVELPKEDLSIAHTASEASEDDFDDEDELDDAAGG